MTKKIILFSAFLFVAFAFVSCGNSNADDEAVVCCEGHPDAVCKHHDKDHKCDETCEREGCCYKECDESCCKNGAEEAHSEGEMHEEHMHEHHEGEMHDHDGAHPEGEHHPEGDHHPEGEHHPEGAETM
ncbi:hypothetical protein GYB22_05915 [bacterium]|nr:hypothetical protein [bacterium]